MCTPIQEMEALGQQTLGAGVVLLCPLGCIFCAVVQMGKDLQMGSVPGIWDTCGHKSKVSCE